MTLECLVIRQRLQENVLARWVHSRGQLADCLTKSMDASVLRECLKTGRYALFDEQMNLKERATKRSSVGWYHSATKTAYNVFGTHSGGRRRRIFNSIADGMFTVGSHIQFSYLYFLTSVNFCAIIC